MPFDLAEQFIEAAQRELGGVLPASYKRAMCASNGGEIDVLADDWRLYPIKDTSDRRRLARTASHILHETEVCRTWASFPHNAVAIAGNGSGDQLVFLREGESFASCVYVWSHEAASLTLVASDFNEIPAL